MTHESFEMLGGMQMILIAGLFDRKLFIAVSRLRKYLDFYDLYSLKIKFST